MSVTISGMRSTSTFAVSNGGTGQTSFTSGALLIGNDSSPVGEIPVGSEGQVLTVVSGAWTPANNSGGNGGGGGGGLSTVYTSGNISGDGSSGSPVTLNSSVTVNSVTAATGTISGDLTVNGNFYVNGSQTFVNSTDLAISDKVILIASGAANQAQLDGAGIHFGNVPSEDARVIYDAINDWMEIYPSVSSSAYIGDGSGLTNLPDPTVKVFTAAGFSAGQVVALSGSLVAADKSNNLKSNAFGVVSAVNGTSVTVKLLGEVSANGASSYATLGTPVYVGVSGSVVDYASLSTGDYVTQVGFISDTGKIIIQPRIFGQL